LFALIVDRLQDPGNLGTLLRSALGAGVHAVLLTPGTVDPFNPKVVRAAAGAHFHLPIATLDPVAIQREFPGLEIVVAHPQALRAYDERDWTRASAVVIGSEAHGISAELARLAADEVRIPLRGGVESLNAGVAGSIILFEAARQRRHAERKATTGE
jgi:TrmH family RNA methyltransferase